MEPAPAGVSTGIVEEEGGEAKVGVGIELMGEGFDGGTVGHFQRLEMREERFFGRARLRPSHDIRHEKSGLSGSFALPVRGLFRLRCARSMLFMGCRPSVESSARMPWVWWASLRKCQSRGMASRTSPGLPPGKLNLFGPQIQRFRMERGWSQVQFLLRLRKLDWNIQPSVLANIETGRRSLTDNELVLLLRALNKTLADLR